MRELSQIDQELRQVRRDLDRAGKLDAMLADLGKQHLQQRKKAAEAFERLNRAEEKEAFLASGREAEHETGKLRRDKQEVARPGRGMRKPSGTCGTWRTACGT